MREPAREQGMLWVLIWVVRRGRGMKNSTSHSQDLQPLLNVRYIFIQKASKHERQRRFNKKVRLYIFKTH